MGVYELPKREKDMHTSYLWANLPLILQNAEKEILTDSSTMASDKASLLYVNRMDRP